ncbi:MAG: thymidine phosphorylase, partial [Nitratireductor sp.]|nr:thymidine phosphorylase [Nitratireductor sp.]
LITASILSKKLAAGLKGLVLDVKVGSGAFMDSLEKARELAASLVGVANGAGLKTTALLTDMDHPLASAAGNAVEMQNAIDFLTGSHVDRTLFDVTVALGAEMLVAAGIVTDSETGSAKMAQAFSSGAAAERFGKMVSALGGPADLVDNPQKYLTRPPLEIVVEAGDARFEKCKGRLAFDTRQIGLAVIELGGGRTRPQDPVDHAVGIVDIAGRDWDGMSPLCRILARDEASAERAKQRVLAAVRQGSTPPPAILERVEPGSATAAG